MEGGICLLAILYLRSVYKINAHLIQQPNSFFTLNCDLRVVCNVRRVGARKAETNVNTFTFLHFVAFNTAVCLYMSPVELAIDVHTFIYVFTLHIQCIAGISPCMRSYTERICGFCQP